MTRETDFLGRDIPWGGKELENILILDREDWVFTYYHPYAVICTGSEMREWSEWSDRLGDFVHKKKVMPIYGLYSFHDLNIFNDNDDIKIEGSYDS